MKKQVEIARIALTTTDEEVIIKLFNYAKKLMGKENQKFPCQYTIEEVKEGIKQSIKEVEAGKVTLYDAVIKRYML